MSLKIQDILNRSLIRNLKYINPGRGNDRSIKRVSVYDSPVRKDVKARGVIQASDLIISSCFFQKDDTIELENFIDMLYDAKCAGLLLSNQYIKSIDPKILEKVKNIEFPVLIFDHSIAYAEIIQIIMEEIINDRNTYINELRIEKLLSMSMDNNEIKEMVYNINPDLSNNIIVIYIKRINKSSRNRIYPVVNFNKEDINYEICHYKGGFFIICSLNDVKFIKSIDIIDLVLNNISIKLSEYIVGVSDCHENIFKIPDALQEALYAFENVDLSEKKKIYRYKDIGINRLIISNNKLDEMLKFYNEIILPLTEYDENQKNCLYNTLVAFVVAKGDFKETSKILYTHENTIRYRIAQIKSMLNKEDNIIEFYELISMALRIEKHLKQKGVL